MDFSDNQQSRPFVQIDIAEKQSDGKQDPLSKVMVDHRSDRRFMCYQRFVNQAKP